jgi:hypothetical protein
MLTFLIIDGHFLGLAEFFLSSDWLSEKIRATVMSLKKLKNGHFDYNSRSCANSEQISKPHVYRVTKCVDSDSGVKIKI